MRTAFVIALLSSAVSVAFASKPSLLPRTLWERKVRTDKRRTQTDPDSSEELRNMLNINEGTLDSFRSVTTDLLSQIKFDAVQEDPAVFTKMFKTFKILQQSPAYKDAITSGADLNDPKTQSAVLEGAVTQFVNLASNLGSAMATSKEEGGINKKVLEFLEKGDETTLALADRVQKGDSAAIYELQQNFFDANFPGLTIKDLPDDEFVKSAREWFKNGDFGMKELIGEENTLDVLMDDTLLFSNNPTLNGLM